MINKQFNSFQYNLVEINYGRSSDTFFLVAAYT
jgi:hypothetical protein